MIGTLFWLVVLVSLIGLGLASIYGGGKMLIEDRGYLMDRVIGGGMIVVPILVALGVIAVANGEIVIDPTIRPGCYRVDTKDTTTYVMSGKVLVPITTTHNTYFEIPCP